MSLSWRHHVDILLLRPHVVLQGLPQDLLRFLKDIFNRHTLEGKVVPMELAHLGLGSCQVRFALFQTCMIVQYMRHHAYH